MKNKSALLLPLLFGLAWIATSNAKTEIYVWVYKVKIEGPAYLLGGDIKVPTALFIALALLLWLQRDNLGRAISTVGAAGSLLFCVEAAQMLWWSGRLLYSGVFNSQPLFAVTQINQELWIQIIYGCIALTLSALCLWLCVRAAAPHQPRPIASWRDWANWNAHSRRTEGSNA